MKIYVYKNCDSCRKALKWLREKEIKFATVPIRETPPSLAELKTMLAAYDGNVRRLFNTSGMDYRSLKLKDKLPGMPDEDALQLLHQNGNLVKRPFLLGDNNQPALVGFNEKEWNEQNW